MRLSHTTGPLLSGIVATHFGYANAFIGGSLALVVFAGVFLVGIDIRTGSTRMNNV